MKTRWSVASAVLLLLACAATAWSSPITGLNVRTPPVAIGASSDPGASVQNLLNLIYSGLTVPNYMTDQQTAGMWSLPGAVSGSTVPILQFEYGGVQNPYNGIGIFTAYDTTGPITRVPVFLAGATGDNDGGAITATLSWSMSNPNTVTITGNPGFVNTGSFSGINRYFFGFYVYNSPAGNIPGSGEYYYSYDGLNNNVNGQGAPSAVAYAGSNGRWSLFFENSTGTYDFNDTVVTIESIVPVPEPGSMLLLGSGLIGLAGALRRHLKK